MPRKAEIGYGPVVYGFVFDSVTKAHREEDWCFVANWLTKRFGVDVSEEFVRLTAKHKSIVSGGWSSGTLAMWWKNRLDAAGAFKPGGVIAERINLPVVLHVFFWAIEETEQMVKILQNEPMSSDAVPQTPAIERTLNKPEPINSVAARVVRKRA